MADESMHNFHERPEATRGDDPLRRGPKRDVVGGPDSLPVPQSAIPGSTTSAVDFPELSRALDKLAEQPLPPGLNDRIFAASVAMLPMPADASFGNSLGERMSGDRAFEDRAGIVGRIDFVAASRRWAPRLAMAASIGLALIIGSPFVSPFVGGLRTPGPTQGIDRLFIPTLFANTSLGDPLSGAEPMLLALLCDENAGGCWISLDVDGQSDDLLAAVDPDVDSLLTTRGARYADLAAEFDRILRDAPGDAPERSPARAGVTR